MKKKYSLIVGILAGSLLFSSQAAEASMTTGNVKAASETKVYSAQPWKTQAKYKYHYHTSKPNQSKPNHNVPQTPNKPAPDNKEEVVVGTVVQQVIDLTNKERAKAGLKALQMDSKLMQSAQAKSQDMKNKNYFSHTSPTYGSPFQQMKSMGITYRSAAENIAKGQRSATEVVNAWMKSPGHKANIMNPSYTHIGVGLSDSGYYWTQQFIGK